MKNISKNISIIFLILSIFLLSYLVYVSEVAHSGTKRIYYLNYYYISFILLLLSIASFFISKDSKFKILLLITVTILGLYIVEFYLQKNIFGFKIKNFNKLNIEFDNRSKLEIYHDKKRYEHDIVVAIPPKDFLSLKNIKLRPLAGISNRKTIHCNESGYYSIYKSDRYGFNNPDSEWNKEQIEFLLIGDSFTHGSCVNEPNTIGGNLRRMLKNGGVLNLGYEGNGPLIEYATLREYFSLINVKRVIWVYFTNDIKNLKEGELNDNIFINYLDNPSYSQNLYLRQKELDALLEKELLKSYLSSLNTEATLIPKFNLKKFLKLSNLRIVTVEAFFKRKENLDNFERIINLSRNYVQKNNETIFYFVYVPESLRYSVATMKSGKFENYANIISTIKKLNIPIIDLHKEIFKNHNNPLSFFSGGGHLNEKGLKILSDTIFKKVADYENKDKG